MHPSEEIMVDPFSEIVDPSEKIIDLTRPVKSVKVIRIDPLSGNKEKQNGYAQVKIKSDRSNQRRCKI